jgi:hypothetical protein
MLQVTWITEVILELHVKNLNSWRAAFITSKPNGFKSTHGEMLLLDQNSFRHLIGDSE